MWGDDGWGWPWLMLTIIVFLGGAVFAGLCKEDGEDEAAQVFAIVALTAYLWPVYLVLAALYGIVALVAVAVGVANPIPVLMERVQRTLRR